MSHVTSKIATCVVALGLFASPSIAGETLPLRGPIPFSTYDQDGNGLVSEAEFNAVRAERMAQRAADGRPMRNAANAPAFADFDANGDGNLTAEELTAGQQQRMGQRSKGQGPGAGNSRNMPSFADVDTDGDGSISPAEFAYHQRQRQQQ